MNGKPAFEIDRMAVKISHLDQLLGLTGEIIITASNMSILQRHLQGQALALDKETMEMIKNAALTSNRISSDLHHLVMDIRLIPIRDTFLRFRRLVRDLGKKKGRQINFEIVGEDTLVDKTIAERLYEPLAHQIRNAIDHGLEDPLERKQAGKDPVGHLTLTAYKKEGFTYVSVGDDGRGLDASRIRRVAVERGLMTAEAASALADDDALALVMQPGFSTTIEATEISGRGVGMDVVKSAIGEMGGEVLIDNAPGRGATFTYRIPQLSAVNITDALIIRADTDYYAVPIGNVVATQAVESGDIHRTMDKTESVIYLGHIVPLFDLQELLTGRAAVQEDQLVTPVIIIESKNGRLALKVSEFIRPQKLVLIPLPDLFSVHGVSGTTILGGNQLGLVLEPFELIALATDSATEASDDLFLKRATVAMDEDFELPPAGGAPAESGPEPGGRAEVAVPAAEVQVPGVEGDFAEAFFLEIQGILTDLNEDVFQLEKDPENRDRVNTIFRHFHSIKGNLIMTGFTALGNFVHRIESILDRIRDKELEVDQEIIDLLLDGIKALEAALASLRAGQAYEVRDKDLLALLERYQRQETTAEEEDEDYGETFRPSPLGLLLLQAKTAQGARVYQSLIRFNPRFQEPYLVAYLILRRLALLGDVLDTVPPLERIEKGLAGDSIKVLFATDRSLEEVDRFMNRQLKRHYDVMEFENLLME
ncbi:MAG: Hpt domain-containing protein [Proteobacteria bacterium]|nr:Hpt domain-containing protein [Pseudomonadota bacterium]